MSPQSWLKDRPIAHRGLHDGNKRIWENTRSAFQRAIDGNHPIECDVHLTMDGQVVVFHDSDLKRLTGNNGKVHETKLDAMKAMPIGGTADNPLSLQELLSMVNGRVPLIIELKGDEGHDDGLVAATGRALNGYAGKAAVMSFDHHLIRQFKHHCHDVPCGLTAEGLREKDMEAHFSMLAHEINFVSYNVHHLPNPFISFVRAELNMPVITWTVRSPDEFEKTYAHADQPTFEGIDPDRVATQ